ncbi:aminopeptidase [Deinococcus peraridilitoris]|uniref:Leucyl aminopeptidase (Aminopeptidase T) n=1 Tax=Deinococcus peraridilitoris (strain DSM 19664 / LMG 22246 / CIP 109416 / KR-200) TaxID=937777 RepID=L0A3B2_DEIPD|nr:aminopeptidase [Deinococcus peraridilitoris]AFZ68336.1 leucyl aminopeptidase (aminopeptidase T) [Deinococcus peraridilitoris DSM 19664]
MSYDHLKHARLLVDYCVSAQPGERILVQGSTLALPLVEALHNTLLQRGAFPVVRLEYPSQSDDFYRFAPDAFLDTLHPLQLQEIESLDGSIRILTPSEPAADLDPVRSARHRKTLAPVARERARRKWNLTLYPTAWGAHAANMTSEQYEAFVASAMFLDTPDPVEKWAEVRALQAQLIARLARADEVRILGPETDLRLSVKGRTWANSDGKRNMPSGEVFTGPLETSANGHIYYGLPTIYNAQVVRGIRLTFQGGQVVAASAEEGDAVLRAALETDAGSRFLGELGIGSNYGIQQASQNILFDEKIGGTVHLALGNSYPETGGKNESALHWDMIADLRGGGQILLDGEVFQEQGRFVG